MSRLDREAPLVRRAGDAYFEGPDTAQWVEDYSPHPARVISVVLVAADRP